MTFVTDGHILLTPVRTIGSGQPERGLNNKLLTRSCAVC